MRIQRQIAFAAGLFQGDVTVRTLLESLAEGVVIVDNSGTILLVNTRAEQMFGYPKKDLIGKPHTVLIPERFRKVHDEHEAHFFAEPKIRSMGHLVDLVGRRRDGSEFPVEISLSFMETLNGVLALAFASDITLRKEYESHLQKSQELFRIQVECVKDYAIFMLDAEGNVLNWNAGAKRLKGYRDEEIIGKHFSCFYPEEDRAVGKPADELKKAAAEGRVEDEGWRIRKDGSRFWADVIITALRDENGNLRGFSKVTRDISEHKRAEKALKISETSYRRLFETAKDGILILEADTGQITDVNPFLAEMLGYSREELLGKKLREIGAFIDIESSKAAFEELQRKEYIRYDDVLLVTRDGQRIDVEFVSNVYMVDSEKVIQCNIRDITARKRAEEEIDKLNSTLAARAHELEAANQELEAFGYTVAHDLRKPLTVVIGYCQALSELCSDKLDEAGKGYVQEACDSAWRMNRLIDTLLKFSSLTRVEPHREKVDLSAMAHEVAEELKLAEPGRRVTFRIAEGIMVNGDANLLRVVLENLIGNAWKYTARKEEAIIEFCMTEAGGKQVCFVRDNGTGFAMTDADKLFIPFQRLPGAEEFRGHGVGLASVERIIRRHGGRVWAEGEPGKGACFYFTLSAD